MRLFKKQRDKQPERVPVPCTVDTSCEDGHHTCSWPCDYAPGTGRLYVGPDTTKSTDTQLRPLVTPQDGS